MPSLRASATAIGFLVGVDHEQHVRKATHFLDAAERAFQLVAFTQKAEQFLLGQARTLRGTERLFDGAKALDRI